MSDKAMTWEEAVLLLRNQPENRELVEHCFYDDPIAVAAERYYGSSEWAAVRQQLPRPAGRVLDIGAGRGISSYAFARDGWQVTALEPDTSGVVGSGAIRDLASQTGVTIDVCNTWGESLPFPAGEFDLVYCRAVLHHARDLRQLCAEVSRVLKPGGLLLATREHVVSSDKELTAFLASHPLHRLYGGEHAYRLGEYKGAITAAGLRLSQVLSPYGSDINMFPESRASLIARKQSKLKFLPAWLPWSSLLDLYGFLKPVPGRLYTFLAIRP